MKFNTKIEMFTTTQTNMGITGLTYMIVYIRCSIHILFYDVPVTYVTVSVYLGPVICLQLVTTMMKHYVFFYYVEKPDT